jgi:hypothetical protein
MAARELARSARGGAGLERIAHYLVVSALRIAAAGTLGRPVSQGWSTTAEQDRGAS